MTSISKLEIIDTSRAWKINGNKITIGNDEHVIFEHESDAYDAMIAHHAVDDTLSLVEASKVLVATSHKDPGTILDSGAWKEFMLAINKFTP
jgi:hypothetical protein